MAGALFPVLRGAGGGEDEGFGDSCVFLDPRLNPFCSIAQHFPVYFCRPISCINAPLIRSARFARVPYGPRLASPFCHAPTTYSSGARFSRTAVEKHPLVSYRVILCLVSAGGSVFIAGDRRALERRVLCRQSCFRRTFCRSTRCGRQTLV